MRLPKTLAVLLAAAATALTALPAVGSPETPDPFSPAQKQLSLPGPTADGSGTGDAKPDKPGQAQGGVLLPAPPFSPADAQAPAKPATRSGTSGTQVAGPWTPIDTSDLRAVKSAYDASYRANDRQLPLSTGDNVNAVLYRDISQSALDTCESGTPTTAGVSGAASTWNFFRALNGLQPVEVTNTNTYSDFSQASALIMAASNNVSHYPRAANGFRCLTDEGVLAAGHGNIAVGSFFYNSENSFAEAEEVVNRSLYTPASHMRLYFDEPGKPNDVAGHRIQMLDPYLRTSGIGFTKQTKSERVGEGYTHRHVWGTAVQTHVRAPYSMNSTALEDDLTKAMVDPNRYAPEMLSWPTKGWFPNNFLPKDLFPECKTDASGNPILNPDGTCQTYLPNIERWHFSLKDGDLRNASVKVTDPYGTVLATKITAQQGVGGRYMQFAGYESLVWSVPMITKLPKVNQFANYTVTITGAKKQGSTTQLAPISYQVRLFHPDQSLTQTMTSVTGSPSISPTTPPPTATTQTVINWAPPAKIGVGWDPQTTINAGDWDRNGQEDLMLVLPNGTLRYYPMTSATTFGAPRNIGVGWQGMDPIFGGVDFDRDGNPDLLARRKSDGALMLYRGNGRGGFAGSRQIGNGWNGMRTITVLHAGLGRRPTIVATTYEGQMLTFGTDGRGKITSTNRLGFGWRYMTQIEGAADFDRDGLSDLLVVNANGDLIWYRTTLTGGMRAGIKVGNGWQTMPGFLPSRISAFVRTVRGDGVLFRYVSKGIITKPVAG